MSEKIQLHTLSRDFTGIDQQEISSVIVDSTIGHIDRTRWQCSFRVKEGLRLKLLVHGEDIAATCNLSLSRLAHLFTEHYHVSAKSKGNTMRLQNARRLLLASEDSISAIARQLGYDNPSQFTHYFSKNVDCGPRQLQSPFNPTVLYVFNKD